VWRAKLGSACADEVSSIVSKVAATAKTAAAANNATLPKHRVIRPVSPRIARYPASSQRFVPRHESNSTAAHRNNDSPLERGADKVIDAGEKDLRWSEAFLQHWLQVQQIDVCRSMMFYTCIMYQTSRFDIEANKTGMVSPILAR